MVVKGIRQCMCHACSVVMHFATLTADFYEDVQTMSSFFLTLIIDLINW